MDVIEELDSYYSKPGRPTKAEKDMIDLLRSNCQLHDTVEYTVYDKLTKTHRVCRGVLKDINNSYFRVVGGKWHRFDKAACVNVLLEII